MASIEPYVDEAASTTLPVVSLSETAASRLLAMMEEKNLEGYALRVFVSGGGCSGLQYGMTFDDEQREGDADFVAHHLRVLVDPISAQYMQGATVDYVDSLMGGGFKIDNPNAVSSCGCGHSFRTAEQDEDDASESDAGTGCGSCSSQRYD
ncbi:MAG: iron-sulfur cluster insertion protein ErpA [Chloroflexaceae bacterium]|nr:iron-sulfur cluster insertion protein ErpA [Chloroflexaceae bacterium]